MNFKNGAVKASIVYTLPWFFVAWIISVIWGVAPIGPAINTAFLAMGNSGWLINGLITIALTWIVWLGFGIDDYLNRRFSVNV